MQKKNFGTKHDNRGCNGRGVAMMKGKKTVIIMLLLFSVVMNWSFHPSVASAKETEVSDSEESDSKYYKTCVNDAGEVYLEEISQSEFEERLEHMAVGYRYVEGWEVVSLSGITVAYVTLHYDTVTSAGKKVFDLSNMVLDANPQNNYAGHLEILSSSAHSLNVRYDYRNLLGDSGSRTHTFYPQQ